MSVGLLAILTDAFCGFVAPPDKYQDKSLRHNISFNELTIERKKFGKDCGVSSFLSVFKNNSFFLI
jgi:hypothetical protein